MSAAYMREYMRGYRAGLPPPKVNSKEGVPCLDCGRPCKSKSGRCRSCLQEWQLDNDLRLVPNACRHCGIRPAPKYDRPGAYVPTIVDGVCDDCELRIRRLAGERVEGPRVPLMVDPVPVYEAGYKDILEIPLYLVVGSRNA